MDFIFNFASPASPVDYARLGPETLLVGSAGTVNTLELARRYGAGYLHASTSECYGDPEVHPQVETYWGRVNPIGPRSVYDEAKRFSEAAVMAWHRYYGVDTHMVRIFNTYGPRLQANDGRVISNFMMQALRGEPLTIYGDGMQTRSFCYVSDLIDGIVRLGKSERAPAGEYREPDRVHDAGVRAGGAGGDGVEVGDQLCCRCRWTIPRGGGRILRRRGRCWGGSRRWSCARGWSGRWSIFGDALRVRRVSATGRSIRGCSYAE